MLGRTGFLLAAVFLPCFLRGQTVDIDGKKCAAPRPTYSPEPSPSYYPRESSALAVLWLLVDEKGHPHDVKLARSSGSDDFDREAVAAVRGWRFKPAMCDGKPVATHINVEVNSYVVKR